MKRKCVIRKEGVLLQLIEKLLDLLSQWYLVLFQHVCQLEALQKRLYNMLQHFINFKVHEGSNEFE